jgi:hypothetical protein
LGLLANTGYYPYLSIVIAVDEIRHMLTNVKIKDSF